MSGRGSGPRAAPQPETTPENRLAVWAQIALGLLVSAAAPFWPYARACGVQLAFYLAAVGMVLVTGGWGGFLSWRYKMGWAYVTSCALLLWGLTLAAGQILPRAGYASITAAWACVP